MKKGTLAFAGVPFVVCVCFISSSAGFLELLVLRCRSIGGGQPGLLHR